MIKTEISDLVELIKNDTEQTFIDEQISLCDIELASNVVKTSLIDTELNCLYFFSCANLLNAYTKRQDAEPQFRKNYFFKKFIQTAINNLIKNDVQFVKINVLANVVYVEISGLQFSFHNIKIDTLNILQKDCWCGIRLQPYSYQIFKIVNKYITENQI